MEVLRETLLLVLSGGRRYGGARGDTCYSSSDLTSVGFEGCTLPSNPSPVCSATTRICSDQDKHGVASGMVKEDYQPAFNLAASERLTGSYHKARECALKKVGGEAPMWEDAKKFPPS